MTRYYLVGRDPETVYAVVDVQDTDVLVVPVECSAYPEDVALDLGLEKPDEVNP